VFIKKILDTALSEDTVGSLTKMHHFGCVVCLVCFFNAVLSQAPSQSQGGLKLLSEAETKALIAFSNDFNGAR
jgi:hypothetical protein